MAAYHHVGLFTHPDKRIACEAVETAAYAAADPFGTVA